MAQGTKTPLFSRKQDGGMFSIVDESVITGNIWWVDSGKSATTGANISGKGQNPDSPFITLDYAINQCEANNHDHIIVMAGHAETLTTAGAVAIDVAGITIWGLGQGSDRPTFTFSSTDNSASILITAANTVIKNIVGVCGDDGLTNPFHIQAADCDLDIEWQDGSATAEAASVIVGTDAADRLTAKLVYDGFTGGDACVSPILLDGSIGAEIDVNFYGKASVAVVRFNDTAVVDVNIKGYFYNSGTTTLLKNVVDTATGSTWFVEGYDGAAGVHFVGGSGNTITPVASLAVREATGDADFDVSAADYTTFTNLMTVTAPATGLIDCTIDLDFNKATTGWDTDATAADTLDVVLVKQVDGTNYRSSQLASAQIIANGDGTLDASESGMSFKVGPMQANSSVQIHVKVSAERGDAVIPYRVTSIGAAPTITPVAAG